MRKILLFAGTTEGRLLCEYLIHQPVQLHVCVATDYGRSLLPTADNLTVSSQRMDSDEMTDFIQQNHFELVLDATHPYALDVTRHIRTACEHTGTLYQRILRDCGPRKASPDSDADSPASHDDIPVDNIACAIDYLMTTEGPIFLTTGSKALADFMQLPDAPARLFVRILPNAEIVSECRRLGLSGNHIFCMQGLLIRT